MSQTQQQPSTTLTDASGRRIEFRPLNPGEQFRLVKILGKGSDNTVYMSMALMAAAVRTIGDFPVPFPRTENDLEHILNQLGDDGLAAIKEHITPAQGEQGDTEDAVMESAKN